MNEDNRITIAEIPYARLVTMNPLRDVAARSALATYANVTPDKTAVTDILKLLGSLEFEVGLVTWISLSKDTLVGSETEDVSEEFGKGKRRIFKVGPIVKPFNVWNSLFSCELIRVEDIEGWGDDAAEEAPGQ